MMTMSFFLEVKEEKACPHPCRLTLKVTEDKVFVATAEKKKKKKKKE